MPYPHRDDVDDFFAKLEDHQRDHLEALRRVSLEYFRVVTEELRWNQPAYIRDGEMMWMLQAYAKHCSLRFTPAFYGDFVLEVAEAGYESGAGFLKIPYAQEVPVELCRRLIEARLATGE